MTQVRYTQFQWQQQLVYLMGPLTTGTISPPQAARLFSPRLHFIWQKEAMIDIAK